MTTRNPEQTRERLLETAFQEMHARGFQGMRVDEVLRQAGLQKGAFYHHFASKTDLAYAVLEEQVRALVQKVWIAPLANIKNPVEDIPKIFDKLAERASPAMRQHGCPLNNLAQEMATQDEGFRLRIAALFGEWIDTLAQVFDRGKADGYLSRELDSRAAARFVVAVLEGCVGLFKLDRSPEHLRACRSQLASYLQAHRSFKGSE